MLSRKRTGQIVDNSTSDVIPGCFDTNRWKMPMACTRITDKEVVESFFEDQFIHRMSQKKLFDMKPEFHCKSHADCSDYSQWMKRHPDKYLELCEIEIPQAIFKPVQTITKNGIEIRIKGVIESINPPCNGEAENGALCKNCHAEYIYLKGVLRKRKQSRLKGNRISAPGMRNSYLTKSKLAQKQEMEKRKLQNEVAKIQNENKQFDYLEDAALTKNESKFIAIFLEVIRSNKFPAQKAVLMNLFGKLDKGRNHHYTDLIKTFAKMHMNFLGQSNYSIFQQLFKLPSPSTLNDYKRDTNFQLGMNEIIIRQAAEEYRNNLVVESSDEARVRRALEGRRGAANEVLILGQSWDNDPSTWPNQHHIPVIDKTKGDLDQYTALERHVKSLLSSGSLAAHVSVHNFSCVTNYSLNSLVFCIWPPKSKGYNAGALFEVHREIRRRCASQSPPIGLLGHSTDSAGFSHSLAKWQMTPQPHLIDQGILYLGLGLPEEKYMAPYFWSYPSIMYLDYEHNQRSCLRMLKYPTLDMSMGPSISVTMDHVIQLRRTCIEKKIDTGLTEIDLILVKFFDQNSDAAYKVFSKTIADLLPKHVHGSIGTELYIRMVIYIMDPYRNVDFGSPPDVVESIATGLTMLRLWRKHVQLTKGHLTAQRGAAGNPAKRGNFITAQTYDSLEIQCHAAIDHQLALFLHANNYGEKYASPKNASTVATEKFIGQMQAKSSHFHSLNQEPSVAEVVDRAAKIHQNIEAQHSLAQHRIAPPSLSNRKKTLSRFVSHTVSCDYKYPPSYNKFQAELCAAFQRGSDNGRLLMQKLPEAFSAPIIKNKSWQQPYIFDYNVNMVSEAPTYDKISVKVNISGSEETSDDDCQPVASELSDEEDQLAVCEQAPITSDSAAVDENNDQIDDSTGGFQVNRNGQSVPLNRALKMALGVRDIISKVRGKRHWAAPLFSNGRPVPKDDNVVLYLHYAVKVNGKTEIVQITSIEKEDGHRIESTKKKESARFRGNILIYDQQSQTLSQPIAAVVTNWLSVETIIDEVVVEEDDDKLKLSDDSIIMLKAFKDDSTKKSTKGKKTLPKGYFEVEDILQERICPKTHEREYLVKYKGYGEEDNEWLPGSTFLGPVAFQTKSRSGRIRKHVTNHDIEEPLPLSPVSPAKKRPVSDDDDSDIEVPKRKSKKTTRPLESDDDGNESADNNNMHYETPSLSNAVITETDNLRKVLAPWGGEYNGVEIINTCPIDSILSMVYLQYQNDEFKSTLQTLAVEDTCCKNLLTVCQTVVDKGWSAAKWEWITKVLKIKKSKSTNTLDCWGDEHEMIVMNVQNSALCRSANQKTEKCQKCVTRSRNASTLEMALLLQDWFEIQRDGSLAKGVLPIEQIVNACYSHAGAVGKCNKCGSQTAITITVERLPAMLMFWLHPFIRNHLEFNKIDMLPKCIKVQKDVYRLLGATVFKDKHWRAVLLIDGIWVSYNPLIHDSNKVSPERDHVKLKKGEELQTLVYVKDNESTMSV